MHRTAALLFTLSALVAALNPMALAANPPAGFLGFAWGTSREAIVQQRGPHDLYQSEQGTDAGGQPTAGYGYRGAMRYRDSVVYGRPASVTYYFEKGCARAAPQYCRLASGSYSFADASQAAVDEVEARLTAEYGPPAEVGHATGYGYRFTSYVRHTVGGKIEHVQSRVADPLTTSAAEQVAAGSAGNAVKFFAADYR